jgi:predicted permease
MIVLQSLFPVFFLLLLGAALKRFTVTNEVFLKTADRLVYFIFFPVMLFWKIGGAPAAADVDFGYIQAALCALLTTFALSTAFIRLRPVPAYGAGSFSQSCYRFNSYIGMAIVMNALGEAGLLYFSILIGLLIPLINVLAVSVLIWFSGQPADNRRRVVVTLRALVTNPLIIACLAGMLYARAFGRFPAFLDNTFRLMTHVTLPLALLSVGGSLTMAGLRKNLSLAATGTVFKLLVLPVTGYFFLRAFHITGLPFKTAMIFFTLPTSTAIYVLSSQLHSDTDLASAAIMLSTLISFVSLSIALLM